MRNAKVIHCKLELVHKEKKVTVHEAQSLFDCRVLDANIIIKWIPINHCYTGLQFFATTFQTFFSFEYHATMNRSQLDQPRSVRMRFQRKKSMLYLCNYIVP